MKKAFLLIGLLAIAIALSGCAERRVEDPCFSVDCDDENPCTKDNCSDGVCGHVDLDWAQECSGSAGTCEKYLCSSGECITQIRDNCCGNGKCEDGEGYLTCLQDCPTTPKDVLEESIPEIKDYPKLEEVFIDLYVPFKYRVMVGFDYS